MKQNSPNNGLFFETLVKLIQESYRDKKDTKIYQRYKLTNIAGTEREFDIVIESNINSHQILIVIECKDEGRKIEVGEMEAFITKCNRIPAINKKIFVSKKGYQADAVNAAQEAGITLYQLKDIDPSIIQDWVADLGFKKISTLPSVKKASLKFRNSAGLKIDDNSLYHDSLDQKIIPEDFLKDIFNLNKQSIDSKAMEYYNIDQKNKFSLDSTTEFYASFDVSKFNLYAKIGSDKIYLDAIEFEMSYRIIIETLHADVSKAFIQHSNNENKADVVSFESALPNSRFTVIKDPKKPNHIQIMVTKNDGGPLDSLPSFLIPEGLKVTVEENNKEKAND